MPDATTFGLFLTAAFVVAIAPGPGIFYVLTRSLKGGRGEGIASSFGNSVGGLVHVLAAALGLSALLMTSATALPPGNWRARRTSFTLAFAHCWAVTTSTKPPSRTADPRAARRLSTRASSRRP